MFEEKDYFKKMVQQFAAAIGRIIGLKAENQIEESQDVLSDTLKHFINLDKEVLEALPYELLILKVSGSRQINSEKCLMLGELIKHQADIYGIKGETARARSLYTKSLNITISALLNDNDLVSEQSQDIVNELTEKVGLFDVPSDSKLLLFQYYEVSRKYAKAEDMLFDLIDSNGVNNDILAKGMAFYERLKNADPTELEKGNLPIDEVLEGLASLKEYRTEPY